MASKVRQHAFMRKLMLRRVGEVKRSHDGVPLTDKVWTRMCCMRETIRSPIVQSNRNGKAE